MQKTLIIGDIHGCHAELLELLAKAGIGDEDLVVSVGDLVDRGPEPGEVVDWFRARENSVVICGNHERKHVRGVLSYSQQITRLQIGARYEEQVRWMAGLPYHWEREDVRVVHWGLFPGVPLAEVPEDVRAGTASGDARLKERFGEGPWYEHYQDDVPVVFGHAVVGPEPLVIRDRIFGIDTGACHGMRLTGLLLPELKLISVPARRDHWAEVRNAWQAPVLRTLTLAAAGDHYEIGGEAELAAGVEHPLPGHGAAGGQRVEGVADLARAARGGYRPVGIRAFDVNGNVHGTGRRLVWRQVRGKEMEYDGIYRIIVI